MSKPNTLNGLDPIMREVRKTRGLASEIARKCRINRAAVYQWKRVPIEWVHTITDVIGKTPEQMRPDVFKPKARRAARPKGRERASVGR